MTGNEEFMRNSDLDALLGAWLREGDDGASDRIAERALLEVAATLQEGRPRQSLWASFARSRPTSIAAAFGAVAVAVALGVVTSVPLIGPGPPPIMSPSPRPSPTVDPDALVLFTSPDNGYEVLIPVSWSEVESGAPDARKWVGPDGELMVSYGTSIFDGGEVTACAPPLSDYNTCMTLEHGYSVPFDPKVDGVGPISMEVWLDRCDGACPVTATPSSLDQEVAGQDRAVIAGRQLTYVSTFHNRRPVIVYWSEPIALADEARVEEMRSSFRFLDPAPGASETPFVDPTELVEFRNDDDAYRLLLPRFWLNSSPGSPSPDPDHPRVRTFGFGGGAGTRGSPALTISIGEPDGSVSFCVGRCRTVVATTLDELEAELVSLLSDAGSAGIEELHGEVMLGGEAGRFERPDYANHGGPDSILGTGGTSGSNCLGCPGMLYQAYAFHDGRPVVLAFDYWTLAFERISSEYAVQILESFEFLD